jgi:hypothetical protein
MPHNFRSIGLILKALPEAKIIHLTRDPAAVCWSNYKHYFRDDGLAYSYNLDDLVKHYKLYEDLMDFWRQEYGSQFYDLNYDDLTVNQELETRNLIKYLDLSWEEACIAPHKNKRVALTASQQQVKQEVYRGSSEKWRVFEQYVGEHFAKLYD